MFGKNVPNGRGGIQAEKIPVPESCRDIAQAHAQERQLRTHSWRLIGQGQEKVRRLALLVGDDTFVMCDEIARNELSGAIPSALKSSSSARSIVPICSAICSGLSGVIEYQNCIHWFSPSFKKP